MVRTERGQAMVEFTLILFIVAALCAGMVYSNRLLTMDYWALQEARYLAFAQTWVPAGLYGDPAATAVTRLEDDAYFRRPPLVRRLSGSKTPTNDGGLARLLPDIVGTFTSRPRTDEGAALPIGDRSNSPVFFAKAEPSIWHSRSNGWYRRGLKGLRLVETAFARGLSSSRDDGSEIAPDREESEEIYPTNQPRSVLEKRFVNLLEQFEIGEEICSALAGVTARRGFSAISNTLRGPGCARRMNYNFGVHVARNIDFRKTYRDYGYQLDWGLSQSDALQVTLEKEVANQFYSFFDAKVAEEFENAPDEIEDNFLDIRVELEGDQRYQQMLAEARYLGSNGAMERIEREIRAIRLQSSTVRNYEATKAREDAINDLLFVDLTEEIILPVLGEVGGVGEILNSFLLPLDSLPIPPTLVPFMGAIYDSLMRNILSEQPDFYGPWIENSNKTVEIRYQEERGLFPAARRRFQTGEKAPRAQYYLLTQPWHIRRRINGNLNFRVVGTADDEKEDESEEAMLRRRTFGLWFFPCQAVDLIVGPFESISDDFSSILSTIGRIDDLICPIKDIVVNNPLKEVLDFLEQIDANAFLGVDVTAPENPAVRPEAYPGSIEMEGDLLTGEERVFADYIEEQQNYNPEPNPARN